MYSKLNVCLQAFTDLRTSSGFHSYIFLKIVTSVCNFFFLLFFSIDQPWKFKKKFISFIYSFIKLLLFIVTQEIILVWPNIFGRAWLVQLVRSLPSDHKASSSILALPRFEYLCNLLFHLSQLSFPSFWGR